MSIQYSKVQRRLLPRWWGSKKASKNPDFASARLLPKQPRFSDDPIPQAAEDFHAEPSIGSAADLLGNALLTGNRELANDAAIHILQNESRAPQALLDLARSVSATTQRPSDILTSEADDVRQIRRLLRINPANPMLWSDLARHFATCGNHRSAHRCMTTALSLAPNHRWMLRTAARFLVHQDDPVAAHKLLANHPRTRNDPWLIAAEIACAQVAARAPKYWRQANDIVRYNTFPPAHTSELATAVAMMELESGDRKKARKNIDKGLLDPTENTLAQVLWAKEYKHLPNGLELDRLVRGSPEAYEADYRVSVKEGELLAAMSAAKTWADDEPFAARPRSEMAFVASLLDDHKLTIDMARVVYRLDQHRDSTLELNSIFAMLSSGQLNIQNNHQEIENIYKRLLREMEQCSDQAYHAIANLGLWHYRYGLKEVGYQLYQKAISIAQKLHAQDTAALAATFAAREAILAGDANALEVLAQAKAISKKAQNAASEFYLRKLDALRKAPQDASTILSPASASIYLKPPAPTPAPPYRVERNGDRLILHIPKRLT